ncbi:hypothetical protein HB762_26865 (plasmid) [Vibrio campbellii]|uniref:Uncharacterized protein n=1 Tax=Vibrio campbellii TaxID=680 RepID=A0ABY5IKR5_9VIBR|nr:hypothetical protein [Vibrio campbellii]UTZ34886.1 hypothetical protein HB762_26865 [Vibrio campbellii]
MSKSFAVRAKNSDSKSAELVAIVTFCSLEQLNGVLKELYQTREGIGQKKLEFADMGDGFVLQFNNSRFKPENLYITSPNLLPKHKEKLVFGEWMSLDLVKKHISAFEVANRIAANME